MMADDIAARLRAVSGESPDFLTWNAAAEIERLRLLCAERSQIIAAHIDEIDRLSADLSAVTVQRDALVDALKESQLTIIGLASQQAMTDEFYVNRYRANKTLIAEVEAATLEGK